MNAFSFARKNLMRRKTRVVLTTFGIAIGIAFFILMVSIGEGMKNEVLNIFSDMDLNTLDIRPSIESDKTLDQKTLDEISRIPGVERADADIIEYAKISYRDFTSFSTVVAYTENSLEGEDIDGHTPKTGSSEIVVGNSLFDTIAGHERLRIGQRITIEKAQIRVGGPPTGSGDKRDFKIVGVLHSTGSIFSPMGNAIIMPKETMEELFEIEDSYQSATVALRDVDDLPSVKERIEQKYDWISVTSVEDYIDAINQLFDTVQLVFGGIAAVALIVSAIGIVNTMLMSMMERTREIGIMKAIGASSKNILTLFVIESGTIGFLGGLTGLLFGVVSSYLFGIIVRTWMNISFLSSIITIEVAAISMIIAMGIGTLAGLYPARKASLLDPVEALRYQ